MRCKGVQRGSNFGRLSLPRDLPRFRKKGKRSSRQGGHVQDLADRAKAIRSTRVLVDKDAATGEIQQCNAADYG
jgi:hypothetical protein